MLRLDSGNPPSLQSVKRWGLHGGTRWRSQCYLWTGCKHLADRIESIKLTKLFLEMYLGLGRAHFLSPTGQCKAFDRSADGYCRAEGCGMFVLKRFADAVSENDNILGVIKGVEVNQSGNASSITHPHSDTQQQLYNRLLEKANINPHQITCVEAHGTGTQVCRAVTLHIMFKCSEIQR